MDSISCDDLARQASKNGFKTARMIHLFCEKLERLFPDKSRYHIAKKIFGVAPQQYDRYRNPKANARSMPLEAVASARFNSGLTWEKFGKLFDDCFLKLKK